MTETIFAVTNAGSRFGQQAVTELAARHGPARVLAIIDIRAHTEFSPPPGVRVRVADHEETDSAVSALKDARRLLLIPSGPEERMVARNWNLIHAAVINRVERLAYVSISRADRSHMPYGVEHAITEDILRGTGLPAVILRNGWYTENLEDALFSVPATRTLYSLSSTARVASASTKDLAEAAALVLTDPQHLGRRYELSGDTAWNFTELASAVTAVTGIPVTKKILSEAQFTTLLHAADTPDSEIDKALRSWTSITQGDLGHVFPDLTRILGRPNTPLKDSLLRMTHCYR
ncbi:NAD(P)H-binding protein [Streptomyces sp. GQFP]|uniref:NAD(P)H-binding protein n=1 Tax=Streptomyces sp. GQFP TaxID=2907545 RepID=UPI001F36CE3A|nr:NAD(P)H-binding protein [Streptomyces sp. GQFP]UIX29261.1 NAD(P)H-binding protein [Streptomyces sp. GQFP]